MDLTTGIQVLVARREAGLTQAELAKRAGMNRSTLSRLEWSRRQLDPQKAEAIKRALQPNGSGAVDRIEEPLSAA